MPTKKPNKAKDTTDTELKKLQVEFDKWFENSENLPESYKKANALVEKINAVLGDQEIIIQPKTRAAAERLVSKIQASSKQWKNETREKMSIEIKKVMFIDTVTISISALVQKQINTECENGCRQAIKDEKSLLMVDPGFWEQIKHAINELTIAIGIGSIFDSSLTLFGSTKDITEAVANVENVSKPSNS